MLIPAEQLPRIVYLDIETARQTETFEALPEGVQAVFLRKFRQEVTAAGGDAQSVYQARAALFAEYARVVCISLQYVPPGADGPGQMRSFCGPEEVVLLQALVGLLAELEAAGPGEFYLCGHNLRAFDVPFLARRMLLHRMPLPTVFKGLVRPEGPGYRLLDTMAIWQMHEERSRISLDLLCRLLGVPSPKTGLMGAAVGDAFYAGQYAEIRHYCEKDVQAVAAVFEILNVLL